jgi:hypothetical protein
MSSHCCVQLRAVFGQKQSFTSLVAKLCSGKPIHIPTGVFIKKLGDPLNLSYRWRRCCREYSFLRRCHGSLHVICEDESTLGSLHYVILVRTLLELRRCILRCNRRLSGMGKAYVAHRKLRDLALNDLLPGPCGPWGLQLYFFRLEAPTSGSVESESGSSGFLSLSS